MTAAAYDGGNGLSTDGLRLRETNPLGVRRVYEDPADVVEDTGASRRWTFGVAAGALLVAGTFAAGALGLNGSALPVAGENVAAPEHAPTAPGNGPTEIGEPAVAAPPDAERPKRAQQPAKADSSPGTASYTGQRAPQAGPVTADRGEAGERRAPAPAPAPAPPQAPAAAPEPASQPAQRPGPVEQIVTPVTDTVGDVLSPVTGLLSGGGGQQPAMTMINPLGDLLAG